MFFIVAIAFTIHIYIYIYANKFFNPVVKLLLLFYFLLPRLLFLPFLSRPPPFPLSFLILFRTDFIFENLYTNNAYKRARVCDIHYE